MARNTAALAATHFFKSATTQEDALRIVAQRLARWSAFAGNASESDMPATVLDQTLGGLRVRLNTLQSQLNEWIGLPDVIG